MVQDTARTADAAMQESRQKMIAKRFGGGTSATVGGARRKKKAVHKTTSSEDKRLTTVLKKLNVVAISAIEEVNMFQDNGEVIHFVNPKIQANTQSNLYVISGNCETRKLQDMLPGVASELGPESLATLRAMAMGGANLGGGGGGSGGMHGAGGATIEELDEEDEDAPDLVENFEEVAGK
ncbi:NAC domain-containing protein [Tribonema minus]|uniref:Nascent polypeptide-associated complex subunit beta n=1 Tax=Tribonema minus TaxID=303371 RepID=A0A835YVQ9_9STRA|nr:NAC domain-containing protein [Tribonema minus]